MPALVTEARADTGKLNRAAQKCLAHAFAFGREIIAVAFRVGVINRAISFTLVDEFGRQDTAVADFDIVFIQFLVDDAEAVAAANIEREIDIPAKNPDQIHDDIFRNVRVCRGFK